NRTPGAPTDPCVTVSRYTAVVILSTRSRHPGPAGEQPGYRGVTRFQHARAFFLCASCLYFLLTHRCGALSWLSRRSEGRVLARRPDETLPGPGNRPDRRETHQPPTSPTSTANTACPTDGCRRRPACRSRAAAPGSGGRP